MIDHVLVPLDGSPLAECVLPHVLAVSQAFEARVTLLRVLGYVREADRLQAVDPLDWQFRKAKAEAYLQGITARFQEAGLQVHNTLVEGKAADRIIEFAHNHDVNLIALSSHGRSGLSGWNVSSVVQKIILRAYTSTLLVRAYQPISNDFTGLRYRRLLVALDGSQRAECVLPVAINLACFFKAQLLLGHVVSKPEMPRLGPLTQLDIELASQVVKCNEKEARRYLKQLRSRISTEGLDLHTHLRVGEHVTTVLHDLVEQEKIDMVMLAAHGYTGAIRWPYGGVTTSLIAYGTTPLMIMQDLCLEEIKDTQAEIAVRQPKGH